MFVRKLKDFYEAEGSTYVSTERLPVGCSLEKILNVWKITENISKGVRVLSFNMLEIPAKKCKGVWA